MYADLRHFCGFHGRTKYFDIHYTDATKTILELNCHLYMNIIPEMVKSCSEYFKRWTKSCHGQYNFPWRKLKKLSIAKGEPCGLLCFITGVYWGGEIEVRIKRNATLPALNINAAKRPCRIADGKYFKIKHKRIQKKNRDRAGAMNRAGVVGRGGLSPRKLPGMRGWRVGVDEARSMRGWESRDPVELVRVPGNPLSLTPTPFTPHYRNPRVVFTFFFPF
jgi:hypothetical protein